MKRQYIHCPDCHKRLLRVALAEKAQTAYYLCRSCGKRVTYMIPENAIGGAWPEAIFDQAVKDRLIDTKGRVVRR